MFQPPQFTSLPPRSSGGPRDGARPLRVLNVYSGNLYGGIERLLVTWQRVRASGRSSGGGAEGLSIAELDFALCYEGRLFGELRDAGATVHRLPAPRLSRPWTIPFARRALRRLLVARQYDAAVIHGGWVHVMFGSAIRAAGAATIVWLHNPLLEGWMDRRVRRAADAGRVDGLIANSTYTLTTSRLSPATAAKSRVVFCPVGVQTPADVEHRASSRADFGVLDDEEVVIICVSRLEAWKGHGLLIGALALLDRMQKWSCWVVGGIQRSKERRYLDELKALVRTNRLDGRVKFLGERGDVGRLLAGADVFCQPNQSPEPFGIALAEAMLARKPVVTTRMGGPCELIEDGRSGMLVPPDDAGVLSSALSRLIADAALRRRMGDAARDRAAEACDPAARVREAEAAIASALRECPPGVPAARRVTRAPTEVTA